jgi:hypothetical protein
VRPLAAERRATAEATFADNLRHCNGIPTYGMVLGFCVEQEHAHDALRTASEWAEAGWATFQADEGTWRAWYRLSAALSAASLWASLLARRQTDAEILAAERARVEREKATSPADDWRKLR